ncbi:hypothetical protein HDC94_000693 [Leifsonia sp. AK011]|uniref:hypothetical protein n=1 Tax=Leifsonia sp. AK011 TaxID=2723075 RepID=UPI0015C941C2|nr:hypothetical protein [Leifsonia sp. AK011]NYF09537.1 hypothetical protein [Leifsonia sp. AK011]
MPTSSRSRYPAILASALGLTLLLAGCTGTTPTPAETSATDSTGGNAGFSAARDAYDLKLAQCLRDAGFDVKDPQPGEGITESMEGLNEAAGVCMREIGDPPTPGGKVDDAEMLKGMLEWADCFRERGVEVEEPQLGQAFVLPEEATEADVAACIPPV